MSWNGFFEYAGSEIINAERTEAYLSGAGVYWFTPRFNTTAISTLNQETYTDPYTDDAPWTDEDDADTYHFWGVYPLNIVGLDDSTRTATITENINDGGWIGPLRSASLSAVFNVMLTGDSECAVAAGFRWLKNALNEPPCDTGCNGGELCFFDCEPCLSGDCTGAGLTDCTDAMRRTMRNVKITAGPTITAKRRLSDGSAMWSVSFTLTAGIPFQFGAETPLVEDFMVAADPWVPEVIPTDWQFDDTAATVTDAVCVTPAYEPIVDPLCPAVAVPPTVPSIQVGCFTAPEAWKRRWFTIPKMFVPYWGDAVPVVRIQAQADEVRNLRLRFYADLNGDASVLDDPCAYCGDILFSYIPPNHTLIFDAVTQTVTAEAPGGITKRADSLVFQTDGTPFDWPSLTCGFGYVVAVDLPSDATGTPPGLDLSLTGRAA